MLEKDYNLMSADTTESRDILGRLVREWSERFALGQAKYSEVEHLGPAGVFPDVNRKVGRIKRDVWEVMPLPEGAEPTREVILDVIGHLFLMLHLYDKERTRPGGPLTDLAKRVQGVIGDGPMGEHTRVQLHTSLSPSPLPQRYPKRDVNFASVVESRPSGKDGPLAHVEMGEDGELRPGSGWGELPAEIQQAIRDLAAGHEVVSSPDMRRAAGEYLDRRGDEYLSRRAGQEFPREYRKVRDNPQA